MKKGRPLIGERVVLSFKGSTLPRHVRTWFRDGLCGGIVFFKDNFESLEQFRRLVSEIKISSLIQPPLLMIDHEGGRVQRIRGPLPPLEAAMTLASNAGIDEEFFPGLGEKTGSTLGALGFNVNLAPVLDVLTEPSNRVIGNRAYGATSHDVSRWGIGFAVGLLQGKVCPVVKHFPGHGMTREDSHETLPVVELDRDVLTKVHMVPFIDAIDRGLPAVMTAHVLYRELDSDVPATLSKKIVVDILRKQLGFHGVVISDDLDMKAISSSFRPDDIARLTIESTTDILIHCGERESQEDLLAALTSLYSRKGSSDPDILSIHKRTGKFRNFVSSLTASRSDPRSPPHKS